MAILTLSGRAGIAASLMERSIHLAWGSGAPEWDAAPVPESIEAGALVNEIGRRAAVSVRYCVADEAGDIVTPTGRYSESLAPTNNLYMRFNFDFTDAPTATIREAAVYVGTVVKDGLPEGQRYFAPAEIADPGLLLAIEHFPKFERSGAVRQSFEFVITI